MTKRNYTNSLYKDYEIALNKISDLENKNHLLNLEVYNLKTELRRLKDNYNFQVNKEIEKSISPLQNIISELKEKYENSLNEIERLKDELSKKDDSEINYEIDKLKNQLTKDSTNSSIPTSKESIQNNKKRRTNEYNHRKPSTRKSGAQLNHYGTTLKKEKIKELINTKNLNVKTEIHYVDASKYKKAKEKYVIDLKVEAEITKHIFIPSMDTKNVLPKEFYSDITYGKNLKSTVVLLGNYCSLPYNKIKELIATLTDNSIDLAEGTIENVYKEFSNKCEPTILNIENNIKNGSHQYTDETVTTESGKDAYFRGYANKKNVVYKYHHYKGDKPIEEDQILTNYFGTVISDHEKGIFKYGTYNQDCIVHLGRYSIEFNQNIKKITWPMNLYRLLLKFERNRQILKKYGANAFQQTEIELMENEYDQILRVAEIQNVEIESKYWKKKIITFFKRCKESKEQTLRFIHDFTIDSNNNFMERLLRMIKGKTKVGGGFRSYEGAVRFGNIMSIIKTSKLRKTNPFTSIVKIFNNEILFG